MNHRIAPIARLTLAGIIAMGLPLLAAAPAASADPPAVQVVLPVVDGGITVTVAPGTAPSTSSDGATGSPAAPGPAPAWSPAPPPAVAPPAPAISAPPTTPSGTPPTTEGTPTAAEDTAPVAPVDPGTPPPAAVPLPTTTAEPSNGTSATASSWRTPLPVLPTARPTYITRPAPPASPSSSAATGGTAESRPGTSPQNSSSPIRLGVFGHSTDRTVRFQEKMGRPVDIVSVFPARGSWESIMDTWWLDRAPEGFTGTLDVGVPLWQDDGDLATAAAGGYDARWEELGRVLHERYPGSSVRIGWEFNLGGWKHHATDENVEQWKQAFRHASVALKKGGPSLLVDWNPNKGKGDSLADASKAWPGDDVVDIVGLDAYDWWPAYSESTWPEHRDGDQGWAYWVDFARDHGKKFAVPEWGVAPGNDHGGGDNPYYIGVVMDFLAAEHAKDGIVHSAVYFDEPEAYIANSIADGQVPLAGAALAERAATLGRSTSPAPAEAARPAAPPSSAAPPAAAGPGPTSSPGPDAASPGSRDADPTTAAEADTRGPGENTGVPEAEGQPTAESSSWGASDGHGPVPR